MVGLVLVGKLHRGGCVVQRSEINVNDSTNEGLKYVGKNIFTVQYHPEACPGPLDSGYLFDRFLKMMEVND